MLRVTKVILGLQLAPVLGGGGAGGGQLAHHHPGLAPARPLLGHQLGSGRAIPQWRGEAQPGEDVLDPGGHGHCRR